MSTNRKNRTISVRELCAELGLEDFAPDGPVGDMLVPSEPGPSDGGDESARDLLVTKWASSGVPKKTVELLQDERRMHETEAMMAARAIAEAHASGKTWGLLAGGMGSGKSVAAGWWLTAVRCSGGTGRVFVASSDVAALPLGTVHAEQRIELLAHCTALVLDDLGVRDGAGKALHPNLQRVLTTRYDNRRLTLCTSNMRPGTDWPAYLGDRRLVDRWNEIGVARVTRDQSLRGRAA
jgi:DNA replication protein DnaC